MAHSMSSVNMDAETEKKQKYLDNREKLLQFKISQKERDETTKRATDSIDANSLFQVLFQIQTELSQLRRLPEQVNNLEQRMNEASRAASVYDEYRDMSVHKEPPITMPTLKLKDVIVNIPSFNGYKISIFQFARACECARDLLSSVQEAQLVQRIIINKIEGDAYQIVKEIIYTRIVDLLDKL